MRRLYSENNPPLEFGAVLPPLVLTFPFTSLSPMLLLSLVLPDMLERRCRGSQSSCVETLPKNLIAHLPVQALKRTGFRRLYSSRTPMRTGEQNRGRIVQHKRKNRSKSQEELKNICTSVRSHWRSICVRGSNVQDHQPRVFNSVTDTLFNTESISVTDMLVNTESITVCYYRMLQKERERESRPPAPGPARARAAVCPQYQPVRLSTSSMSKLRPLHLDF